MRGQAVIKIRAETGVRNRAGTVSPGQAEQFPSQEDTARRTQVSEQGRWSEVLANSK